MTATNAVMGTPRYMAPEQLDARECDARTDLRAQFQRKWNMPIGRTVRVLAIALCFRTGMCVAQSAKPPQPLPGRVTLGRVLSWLPADTEVVFGASGPFLFPDFAAIPAPSSGELSPAELALRTQFNLPLSLFQLNNGGLSKPLKDKKVALVIEGSRHFRPSPVRGAMRYEGCAIVVMESGTQVDGDAFMKSTASSARRFEEIAGLPVATFEELTYKGVWTTFVAFPRKEVVAVATDLAYLRTVLTRLNGITGPRALPDSLPEWKYLNTRAPVWGIRHYDRSQARLDPTSPFQDPSAANFFDPRAGGVTFYFEPFERKQALITYLSANDNYRSVLMGYLNMADADAGSRGEFQIHFRQPDPGALQGSVSLSPAEALYRLLVGLAAMLGHAASF